MNNNTQKNPYEIIIKSSKKIETLLENNWGAKGRGLGEKASSVSDVLPKVLIYKIYKMSGIRNKVVHEDDFEMFNLDEFISLVDDIDFLLKKELKSKKNNADINNLQPIAYVNKSKSKLSDLGFIVKYLIFFVFLFLWYCTSAMESLYLLMVAFLFFIACKILISILKVITTDLKYFACWLATFFIK